MAAEFRAHPKVSFVILNWNQRQMTIDCLKSLYQQIYPRFSIIVVDNGSTDDSVRVIREQFPEVTIIENAVNVGYSQGNNIGISHAIRLGADYLFLLNNDTEVDPNMLAELVKVAESDPKIGVVGPTMYYADRADAIWGGQGFINWKQARIFRNYSDGNVISISQNDMEPRETDYIDTCAILIKQEVLEKIGYLNPNYFINFDDLDLNMRAREAGYQIYYVPIARMWHKVSATMGIASPATTYYMTRNALLFFWIYAPGIWKLLAPMQIFFRTVRTIGAWSFKKQYRSETYQRKRDANVLALRDFFSRRFGRMGSDVERACNV